MNYRKCKVDKFDNQEFYFHKWFKDDIDKEIHGLLEYCDTGKMICIFFSDITFLDSPNELLKKTKQRIKNPSHLD